MRADYLLWDDLVPTAWGQVLLLDAAGTLLGVLAAIEKNGPSDPTLAGGGWRALAVGEHFRCSARGGTVHHPTLSHSLRELVRRVRGDVPVTTA